MKPKVLTCDCFIARMGQTHVEFEVQNRFGVCECYYLPHRVVATKCNFHHLNVNGFFRNYFASMSCGCQYQERDKTHSHCDRLEVALNVNVLKVCIDEKDFPTESFKFYDFSSYAKTLAGDPFYVYDKDLKCIVKRIDTIDWGDFFVGKEMM